MTKLKMNFLFPFLLLILCLLFPKICAEGAKKGLDLSIRFALPALFPALTVSGMITRSLTPKSKKGALLTPFTLGLCCGFPIGAKATCDLYKRGILTKKEGEKLLFFCNNAGPSFLIGFIGEGLFSDSKKGVFLFLLQSVISCFCLFVFFGKALLFGKKGSAKTDHPSPSFWDIFSSSIFDAGNSYIYIMSCIIFFSFFTELILHLLPLPPMAAALFILFSELTGGVFKASVFSEKIFLPLCALGCGWAGMSVHFQTVGIVKDSGLSCKKYFLGKFFFSLAMLSGTLFFQKLL